jgi:hypothetical protein
MKIVLLILSFCFAGACLQGQNVDIGNIKRNINSKLKDKKYITVSGGINASNTFSKSTAGSGRDVSTYMINGNASINLWGLVSIPLNFTLTNLGASYHYQFPTLPSKLSLHPKYKWITTHIGQISMSYSPYTMSGVPMNGFGVDLTPTKGKLKYSAFYGMLQRAVPYDTINRGQLPTYKRIGYGFKLSMEKGKYKTAVSVFRGKDLYISLAIKPDSLGIFPRENSALATEFSIPVFKKMLLTGEYGISIFTNDQRALKYPDSMRPASWLLKAVNAKISTSIYHAIKSQLSYTIGSSMLGVGYERIDPGFQTLGAFYFSNDLENITFNFAQSLYKGKVNLTGNIGQQKDDLDKKKAGGMHRNVMAFNISFNPGKRVSTSANYSNFQTFTNVKPQFQIINQLTPYANLDTLNFHQLSQSGNFNLNIIVDTSRLKPRNLNINLSLQDAFDEQGGRVSTGNSSQFFNLAGSYSMINTKKGKSVNLGLNGTYNTIGINNSITFGPTLAYSKQLFSKKVMLSTSVSYNQSRNNGKLQASVMSLRANSSYKFKQKHNFSLMSAFMMRTGGLQKSIHDFVTTISYNYSFNYPKEKK